MIETVVGPEASKREMHQNKVCWVRTFESHTVMTVFLKTRVQFNRTGTHVMGSWADQRFVADQKQLSLCFLLSGDLKM